MPPRARARSVFVCQSCGAETPRWLGRCPSCEAWNTLVETVATTVAPVAAGRSATTRAVPLSQLKPSVNGRTQVAIGELNRVLGGGLVPGSVVLLGGDPGIGKSTLLLMLSAQLEDVLYVSGEESPEQIKMRADRLGVGGEKLYVLGETRLEEILAQAEAIRPRLVIIDSIQTTALDSVEAPAGSVSQVRECANALLRFAKSTNTPVFLVGHVTKEGALAGPRVLEHVVDTVLYLEGERFQAFRILRAVKNRFGSTDEIGVFEMREAGLTEVANPSELFLAERAPNADGSAVAVTLEGTRPVLVEIQALTAPTALGLPRRNANGFDVNRLQLLIAVLQKRVGLALGTQDVFVNVVGGLRIAEPAADLALAVAIASSTRDQPTPTDTAFVGEVGLNGELRRVGQIERRVAEAAKLGFKRVLVPKTALAARNGSKGHGAELIGAATVREAIRILWPEPPRSS